MSTEAARIQAPAAPGEGDVIIGLEVHCQLNLLASKLFCQCPQGYQEDRPNSHTCPVCLGLPGALPVINRRAVECAVMVGLALGCEVAERTQFYRKNYYYPDLPRGFQISQYDYPVATGGKVIVESEGNVRVVRIRRVHMEEDPGRLVYPGTIDSSRYVMVDYNRSGVPLLEVVTEPDLRSPKEARALVTKLRTILEYLGFVDGGREGAMRVDANISLAGGKRTEVKNISSYKGVERALGFEITRQRNLRRRGATVVQETRHFDAAKNITISLRVKETEQDYRYFPEPDLPPMRLDGWAQRLRECLPELPDAKQARFVSQYRISAEHARSLTADLGVANYFEAVAAEVEHHLAATWIADVLKGELNYRDRGIASAFPPGQMAGLLSRLSSGSITDKGAVEVVRALLDGAASVEHVIVGRGLGVAESDAVSHAVAEAISEHPQAVADYRAGRAEALNYLVGQVMRKTRGQAPPDEVNRRLREALG